MTAGKTWDGGEVVSFAVTLDEDIEIVAHAGAGFAFFEVTAFQNGQASD